MESSQKITEENDITEVQLRSGHELRRPPAGKQAAKNNTSD
jgi:hypothetical protein